MNLGHNLFLLMFTLSRLSDQQKIIELYVESMNEILKPAYLNFQDQTDVNDDTSDLCYNIRNGSNAYGSIRLHSTQPLSYETEVLIGNSVTLLAVVIDHLVFETELQNEKNRQEIIANERLVELKQMVEELQQVRNATLNLVEDLSLEIEKRKLYERELQETSTKFQEFFNTTGEAIIIYDADTGAMMECNQRALDLYGFDSKEEFLTKKLGAMSADIEKHSNESAEAILKRARSEGVQTFEWICRRKNDSDFWNEISLKTAHIAGYDRIITIERDISERKKNQMTIQDQLNELRRWQETTLGREMRIIDLKREVNSLLAELDKPLKYQSVL